MTSSKPWLKLWTEIRTDIAMRSIDPEWRWAFVGVLCLAQELGHNGLLLLNGKPLSDAAIADAIGVDLAMWHEVRAHFLDTDRFHIDPSGVLCVTNFAKRQTASDSAAAARQARHRQAKATAQEEPPVQPLSDASHALRHALRHAAVTPLQTPTESREQNPENRVRNTENRNQTAEERPTESTSHMQNADGPAGDPASDGHRPASNGHASGSVDPSLFLSVIGFKNPQAFLRDADETLLAQWAYYYQCLNDGQRRAVNNWPALVNSSVRSNRPPRLTSEQKVRFYREWAGP
jgi:hypothetical protein